ncbi:C2 domain-containing protein 2 isoform X2 [Eucyclogobius newberryi]|uniref:C2 domain-containing protein 2 isoform X2 n=1 Tax=Eucyclogobius newberryi TaxID=166745 RepID=UPI003B5CBF4B
MSELESSGSYFGLEDPLWLCMVTLFIASLITLLLYFVQYYKLGDAKRKSTALKDNAERRREEAEALLGWALSLKSWTNVWRATWCRALNGDSRKCRSPVVVTFEEDALEASELVVSQVTNYQKSPSHKAACCRMVAQKLQFCLSAASTNSAASLPNKYTVCIEPLEMQLDLLMKEAEGEIQVTWGISQLECDDLQLTLDSNRDSPGPCSQTIVKEQLYQLLCRTRPSVSLSCRSTQSSEVKDLHNKVASPPKPPRAHDWKLLVKNINAAFSEDGNAAGSINPLCVLQLDDPPQKFCTSVLKNTTNATWEQPFIFELNGRSKELKIQLVNDGQLQESVLGQVSVPFDLVKKQPKGQQTFALMTKDVVTGSLTTEFTYLEPSEVRSWQPPTPASTKRVEMDRTVMPCGTVVTTVTAVKSKPGRQLPVGLSIDTSQKVLANKPKLSERRVSEQSSVMGNPVSKALSSSDTELLMLNGADPVAEAAIRQLHHSAKQKLKSPVKKSTIIISGIAKTPLSQDDELALMAGYAAAMDASMSEGSSSQDVTNAMASGALSPPEETNAQEGPSGIGRPPEDWESNAGEELDNTSLSLCVSEASCKKSREESGAKHSLCPHEQLPSERCEALLSAPAPEEGAGHEPVPQRPGVLGVSRLSGEGQSNSHPQPHAQPQE